jgi:SnoaL-like domain
VAGLVSDLERRVRAIEDRLAITDLVTRYGPAADSGAGEALAALWVPEGTYRFDDTILTHADLPALVDIGTHRVLMAAGCADVLSAPRIDITSDGTAVAVNHSVVFQHADSGWEAVRVSANRWELVRTGEGWRVWRRDVRLLDGSTQALELLRPV